MHAVPAPSPLAVVRQKCSSTALSFSQPRGFIPLLPRHGLLPSSSRLCTTRPSSFQALRASADAQPSTKAVKWLLQPIGDGDCSHLDEAVPLPGAFELSTDAATVGRVAEKADIVIPVATVSGLHARLEKKGGTLYVTDLDSTNGTYVNDRQLRPGAVTPVPPGSRVTFGDDHLAAFKFSQVEEEAST